MARPAAKDLTDRELEIMHQFWKFREATVADVRDGLADQGTELAQTTVGTLVRILHEKGFLEQTQTDAAQDANDKHRPMIDKAMTWLVKQQADDGHWPANNAFPTATTAFAGMALLVDGNTLDQGKYRANLRKTLNWFSTWAWFN